MPTNAECPSCNARLKIPDSAIGKRVRCPKCKSPFRIPEHDDVPVAQPAAPPPVVTPQKQTKACPFCAESIAEAAIKCRHCGSMLIPAQQHAPQSKAKLIYPSSPAKEPILMGLLSGCCIAGLGHLVIGQVTKGVACIVGSIALALVTAGISVFVVFPLMGFDAYMVAKKLKSGRPVTEWESFPS